MPAKVYKTFKGTIKVHGKDYKYHGWLIDFPYTIDDFLKDEEDEFGLEINWKEKPKKEKVYELFLYEELYGTAVGKTMKEAKLELIKIVELAIEYQVIKDNEHRNQK